MKEKQWCQRCHGGVLHTTLIPNEMKCNCCGWEKIEMNFAHYIATSISAHSR